MKSFREATRQAIHWEGKWKYVLRSGTDVLAVLQVEKSLGTRAVAVSADGRWLFEKRWLPLEKVTLRAVDSDSELAVFRSKWLEKKSSLEFSYGLTLHWVPANRWGTRCVFTTVYGEVLVHFSRNTSPLTAFVLPRGESTGRVEIEPAALLRPEIPLLTLLGCYLMVLESI